MVHELAMYAVSMLDVAGGLLTRVVSIVERESCTSIQRHSNIHIFLGALCGADFLHLA